MTLYDVSESSSAAEFK